MSKTVDERVVSMQFDNKNFESNVQTSLSTLDKLKRSLNMDSASKGLEKVNTAAKNVNMSGLSGAVETVHAKFSALEVVGVTALANITNSAVNAGKNIVSALTIEPVISGFQEYETQINAVQTILANTQSKGSTIKDVNSALDKLNTYADKTIYNFTEMTRNIGTFTAAGVDLDTSVSAIKGIANLAAVSGSNSQQASTAMYQLSQAMASGTVKLQDWNSVVNAGMGGQIFQDSLKETARVHGIAVDDMIKSEGSFRESLKEGWLTTEVLTETLNKFTGDLSESQLKSMGYTEKQIAEIVKMGKTANDAATKVKTFTQLFDTLKEAAQSGWSKTWQILIGDFDQAKELFTPLSEFFGGIIEKISDFRNNLLEGALSSSPFADIAKKIESITSSTSKAINKMKDLGDVVDRVIRGDFGSQGDNGDANYRAKKLADAGYDYATVQNKVNEKLGISFRLTTKNTEAQKELSKAQSKSIDDILKMSDAQLKQIGFTKEEIKAFKDLKEYSEKTGLSIKDILKDSDKLNGRTLLINSFKNAGQGLVSVITAIKNAWVEVFPPMTSDQLYNIIAGLHKFSLKLKVSKETADNLKRTLKGVFSLLNMALTIIGGPLKIAFKIFTKILSMFNLDILDVTAAIGDAIVGFNKWLDSTLDFTKIFEAISPYIKTAVDSVKAWVSAAKPLETISKIFSDATAKFKDWIEALKKSDNIPRDIISGLVDGIRSGISTVASTMWNFGSMLIQKICEVLGIHSPSKEFKKIGNYSIEGFIQGIQEWSSKAFEVIKNFGLKCINVIKSIDWGALLISGIGVAMVLVANKIGNALESFASMFEGIGSFFEDVGKGLKSMFKGIGKSFKAKALEKKSKAILNFAIAIGILAGSVYILAQLDTGKLWIAIGALASLAGIILILSAAASKIDASNGGFGKLSLALLGITASLYIMAAAINKLSFLNSDNILPILGGLASMIAGLSTILIVFGKLSDGKASGDIDKAGVTILKISASILLLVYVIKQISGLDIVSLAKGFYAIVLFGSIITGLIAATKLAGNNADKVGSTLLKISFSIMVLAFVIKILSKMKPADMAKGLLCITALSSIIISLIAATSLVGDKSAKIGGTILAISGALLIMSITAKLISTMNVAALAKGVIGIGLLSVIIIGLINAVKLAGDKAPKIALTILAMSLSIGILSATAVLLGLVKIGNLVKGITAVSLLSVMMAILIKSSKDASSCKGTIIAMTVAIGVMALAIAGLSFIDSSKLAGATLALTTVMGMLSLLVKVSKSADSSIATIMVMMAAIMSIAGVLYLLSTLNTDSALKSAIGLSVLLTAASVSIALLGKIKIKTTDALVGILALSAMIAPLFLFMLVLNSMNGINNAIENATALTVLATAMTLLLIPLSLVGVIIGVTGGVALLGIIGLAAMALPLWGFIQLLTQMQGIKNATTNTMLLILLTDAMTNVLIKLAIVGPLALIGLSALSALTAMMVAIGALSIAMGAIMKIPGLKEFLSSGLKIMITLADGIGQMIGAFVGGIAKGVATIIPFVGKCLSQFMFNVTPFITGIKMVNDSVLKGVGILAASVIALTAASLISGISRFFNFGSSFSSLGTELSLFMLKAMPFVLGASMLTSDMIQGVKNLSEAILILTAADILKGIASFFGCETSLADFGKELAPFGESIAEFSQSVSGKIDPKAVEAASKAGKTMAEMASNLPTSGGLFGAIFGNSDMGEFSKQLVSFGDAIVKFSSTVKGKVDSEAVKSAASAGKVMTEFADTIPNSGPSVVTFFTGDNDMATFGLQLKSFGESLASFSDTVKGKIDGEAVQAASDAGDLMVELANKIPNSGLSVVSFFTGRNDMDKFGKQLESFGNSLVNFSSTVSGKIDGKAVQAASNAGTLMASLQASIPKTGGISSVWGGNNDIEDFGKKLVKFGEKMKSYSDKISDIDSTKLSNSTAAFSSIINMAKGTVGIDFTGLGSFSDNLEKLGKTGVDKFIKAFTDSHSKVKTAGGSLLTDIINGVNDKNGNKKLNDTFKSLLSNSVKTIKKHYLLFYISGKYIVNGFCNGIIDNIDKVKEASSKMANAATTASTKTLDEHSPSKVFYRIGSYAGKGFVNALDDYSSIAYDSASGVGESAKGGLSDAISKIRGIIDGDIDVQPTIRPVMDLSDVKSGANTIGGMLSGRRTLSVDTRSIGIISNSMSKIQNGDRSDDIISSIENLRKDISDNPRNVYTINGVTYDDGSNISDAVKSIVRAARIERRT